jgi:PilZ domain
VAWTRAAILPKTHRMEYAVKRAPKHAPHSGLLRCARIFYEVLGNRRRFPRSLISGTIQVECRGYAIETVYTCACIDFSPRGIGIESPEPLRVGSFVTVHSDEHGPRRQASVRYCIQEMDTYRVGLEFVGQAVGRG